MRADPKPKSNTLDNERKPCPVKFTNNRIISSPRSIVRMTKTTYACGIRGLRN